MQFGRRVLFTVLGWAVVLTGSNVCGQTAKAQNAASPNTALTQPVTQVKQSSTAHAPSFEVASVRMIPMNKSGLTSLSPWGLPRFTATNVTLQLLIELGFGVEERQITGAPSWLEFQQYAVDAKAKGDKGHSREEMQPLIQQLLKERFHLAVHRKTGLAHGYVLTTAKTGPMLEASRGENGQFQMWGGHLSCPGCPTKVLAGMLARVVGRAVVDKTGLAGRYDIELDYAPMDDSNTTLPSVYTALQETLGLKLVPQKVPVEMLVIDHMDREPTEN